MMLLCGFVCISLFLYVFEITTLKGYRLCSADSGPLGMVTLGVVLVILSSRSCKCRMWVCMRLSDAVAILWPIVAGYLSL